jgi:hypothetical protein
MKTETPITETEIFTEMLGPDAADWDPAAARAILKWNIKKSTQATVSRLLRKNSAGKISAVERIELDRYLKVASFIDLMKSKARLSLHRAGETV